MLRTYEKAYVEVQDDEYDATMQVALHQSRHIGGARLQTKGQCTVQRGSGSRSSQRVPQGLGPLPRMMTKDRSQIPQGVRGYNLGSSSSPRQEDRCGPLSKSTSSKRLIGRAQEKDCHAIDIPGQKVNDPLRRRSQRLKNKLTDANIFIVFDISCINMDHYQNFKYQCHHTH